jgi:hypothetical protein
MSTHVANYLITEAAMIGSAVFTSAPIRIEKASACAVHLQAIAGSSAEIELTYTLSSSSDGVYVPGEATISASRTAIGVDDWVPEVASWMKLVVTNATAGAITALKVVLAVQED